MKNIKYILPLLLLFSCKKEEVKKSNTCNCYETHQEMNFIPGTMKWDWQFTYNTTKQPDLCDKATGEWVYTGNYPQYRYKVICN